MDIDTISSSFMTREMLVGCITLCYGIHFLLCFGRGFIVYFSKNVSGHLMHTEHLDTVDIVHILLQQ